MEWERWNAISSNFLSFVTQDPSMFALYLLGMISLAEASPACASGSTFLAARRRARMIDAMMATVSTTAITPSESAVGM